MTGKEIYAAATVVFLSPGRLLCEWFYNNGKNIRNFSQPFRPLDPTIGGQVEKVANADEALSGAVGIARFAALDVPAALLNLNLGGVA